jgi:membrane protease YdiL (CAAX protease family)
VLPFASVARALAIASCIPLVLLTATFALATLSLTPADALALDALTSAASLTLLAIAAASLGSMPMGQRLGLGAGRLSLPRVALAALGLLGLSHAAEGLLQLSGATSPGLARLDDALRGLSLSQIGFPFLSIVIGAAVGEELFFRGLLQRGLMPVLGRAAAIGSVAMAFGLVHGDLAHGVAATGLGLYLGVLAWRSDSIRASIAAHALNNTVALAEVALELRIPEGPVATPFSLAVALTLTCVALVAMRGPAPAERALQSPASSTD